MILPRLCEARGVALEILLSDFHFQGWRIRRDRKHNLLVLAEYWLLSKWVRIDWGEKGAFSAEKKYESSGGRPQLMRNCTSSALEKPVWK